MNWVSATYNRLEIAAMAADRLLNAAVERCERWLDGRERKPAGKDKAGAGKTPLSA
jgi:hypothetical protein